METIKEILISIKDNKLRTFMSGFGIAWGLMILVSMLGVGGGVEKGVHDLLSGYAVKSIRVWAGTTSMPYKNFSEGRNIEYTRYLLENLQRRFPEIDGVTPGYSSGAKAVYGKFNSGVSIEGYDTKSLKANSIVLDDKSRFFSPPEEENGRNVAIIGEKVAKDLFGNSNPIGEKILVGGYLYTAIGVIKEGVQTNYGTQNSIYIPTNTFLKNINDPKTISSFALFLKNDSKVTSEEFIEELKFYLSSQLNYSPKDERAIFVRSLESEINNINSVFKGLSNFIWIAGICFLITGMIGIGNIMFVIVKERTNEIGIRMAIGATPKNIVVQFITEALIITFISGLVGVILGGGILAVLNMILKNANLGNFPLKETVFDFNIAIGAMILMSISGVFAGLFPAIKASNIEPVNAIRQENRG